MSNDSDLRAAAERVRRVEAGKSTSQVYGSEFSSTQLYRRDIRKLALAHAALLASHPADSETEIDEAWLVKVGIPGRHGQHKLVADGQGAYWGVELIEMEIEDQKVWHFRGYVFSGKKGGHAEFVKSIRTRSDLRGLCEKLGIPLKEENTSCQK